MKGENCCDKKMDLWNIVVLCITLFISCSSIPLPTPVQLRYQQAEIIATIGFQMDTYAYDDGDPGCNKNNWNNGVKTSQPATLNPSNLNITQWAEVLSSLGAKYAWMNAKHGCGFLMWKTKTKFVDGTPYGYDVSAPGAINRDIVKEFHNEMLKVGIKPGYYYSLKDNFYLNVHQKGLVGNNATFLPNMKKVNQEEFENIILAQLRELWSEYGQLSETWFDGGWPSSISSRLLRLIGELLPNTAAFGGYGVSKNPVKWVGTESGLINGPIWSVGSQHQGDPNGNVFVSTGCDTVLMTPHVWFAVKGMGVRPLSTMIDVYHQTVGNNCVMELGFATLRNGLLPKDQVIRAKEFGDWIKTCYSVPANGTLNKKNIKEFIVSFQNPVTIDRVMIQEDLKYGQIVRKYKVEYKTTKNKNQYMQFSNGTSIGNKRIDIFGNKITFVNEVKLTILETVQDLEPYIKSFSGFHPCTSG